jgi:hypothetical protein
VERSGRGRIDQRMVPAPRMQNILVDRLNDLADAGQPAAQSLGPGVLAIPLRRAHDLGLIVVPPARMHGLPREAFIADLDEPPAATEMDSTRQS